MASSSYVNALAKLCRVQVEDLPIEGLYEIPAQKRLVHDFILNQAVYVGGSEERFPHISDEFMAFMAEFGQECVTRDQETGEVLMELALQRISCGAVVTEEYNFIDALPQRYQPFTAVYDEPALMSQACWDFIEQNIQFCVDSLSNPTWRRHAESILWSLVENINEDGTTNNNFIWNEGLVNKSLKEVYEWSLSTAGICFSPYAMAVHLAPYWHGHLQYFRERLDGVIEWTSKDVRKAFAETENLTGLDGKPYFKYGTSRLLKIFGIYDRVLLAYILRDLREVKF